MRSYKAKGYRCFSKRISYIRLEITQQNNKKEVLYEGI